MRGSYETNSYSLILAFMICNCVKFAHEESILMCRSGAELESRLSVAPWSNTVDDALPYEKQK